jgi:hypothetical protein
MGCRAHLRCGRVGSGTGVSLAVKVGFCVVGVAGRVAVTVAVAVGGIDALDDGSRVGCDDKAINAMSRNINAASPAAAIAITGGL